MKGRLLTRLGLGDREGLVLLHRRLAIASLVLPAVMLWVVVRDTLSVPPRAPMDRGAAGTPCGLDEAQRRALYELIAAEESRQITLARQEFPGQPWSQWDAYMAAVHRQVHAIAHDTGLHYSCIYMAVDEGVRKRWPGPGGKPMEGTVVPLDPRTR